MKQKIIIVGGVAGGATLATRLRRLSEDYEIIMFEKDEYIAFANCGLPYYIGDVITNRDALSVQTVEGLSKTYNLHIRNFSEVIEIDEQKQEVTVKNHTTNEIYKETYDKLVLSPGATPIVPPFAGLKEANNVFTLRNIPDTDKIKNYVNENNVQNATVIGGGFIGVEMAENLAHLGINVTLVDLADHILKPFDQEMAAILELDLKNSGVNILVGQKVKDVRQTEVELESGLHLKTDLTIMAIGVRPTSGLAERIGLNLSTNGAIIVDEKFKTSKENIYAIGDVIEITNPILNNKMHIPLAWPANRQARLLADIIDGQDKVYKGTIGASVLKVNNLTAASVGYTEEFLKTININYDSIIVNRASHASYYPGASNMNLKLIFGEDGKILGAQGIGEEGVEKRIDIISTAIKTGATVYDLEDIEVCYAPPFNSAKDPVNIAGYTAVNVLDKTSKTFKYDEVDTILEDEGSILLDIREVEEVELATIDGAVHIPLNTLRESKEQLKQYKNKKIYVYCQVGLRGYVAQRILMSYGLDVYNLSGGFNIYNIYNKNKNKTFNNKVEYKKTLKVEEMVKDQSEIKELDVRGMQCPGPIMATSNKMKELSNGEKLLIKVTDSGFCEDIKSWCDKCSNELISINKVDTYYEIIIKKLTDQACPSSNSNKDNITKDNGTIVMFSGDLDKSLAAMIIAQGAQSMEKEMTIFFTFWGLNLLRKENNVKVDKTAFEKMFAKMMPKGASKFKLSKMNMLGVGTKMIKGRMKSKNVPSLEEQLKLAQKAGVKFVACTMSMDLMGIKEEELIEGVELGGVAKYIGDSSGADLTLFI